MCASSDLAKGDPVTALHHSNRELAIAVAAKLPPRNISQRKLAHASICVSALSDLSAQANSISDVGLSAPLLESSGSSNLLLGGILHCCRELGFICKELATRLQEA